MSKRIEIDKLRLGVDKNGHVFVGVADATGALIPGMSKEITDDFMKIMETLLRLTAMRVAKKMEEVQEKPKIELAGARDIIEVNKRKN